MPSMWREWRSAGFHIGMSSMPQRELRLVRGQGGLYVEEPLAPFLPRSEVALLAGVGDLEDPIALEAQRRDGGRVQRLLRAALDRVNEEPRHDGGRRRRGRRRSHLRGSQRVALFRGGLNEEQDTAVLASKL